MREIHEAWKELMDIYKEVEQYNEKENVFVQEQPYILVQTSAPVSVLA
jgi:hypothetical protein